MKIPFQKITAFTLLCCTIALISCSTPEAVAPTGTSNPVDNSPLANEIMINGYFPSYRPLTYFSSADYSNLSIAYFAFIVCDANGNIVTNSTNEGKMAAMITAAHAANTKAYLSFGGGGYYGSTTFYDMARNATSRKEFAHQVKTFCLAKGFDGFDVDWEGLANSSQGLAHEALLTTLKDTLHNAGLGLAVTVQQGGSASFFTQTGINQADLVQIMSYDATGTWSGSPEDQHSSYDFASAGISFWKGKGIAASKLVVGVPFYGYNFSNMPCPCAAVTYSSIVAAYPDLDDNTDYLFTGTYADTYFNGAYTISQKAKLARTQRTSGIMIWEISQDATGSKSLLTKTVASLAAIGVSVKKLTNSIP
ncbi:MAG: putative chitinase [Chitinophagaceae bacterium]|nr:putative chitinase [Chitinophagaceae bacterium]